MISANEAREISKDAAAEVDREQIETIEKMIRVAAQKGEFKIRYREGYLSTNSETELKEAGYVIKECFAMNMQDGYEISWCK